MNRGDNLLFLLFAKKNICLRHADHSPNDTKELLSLGIFSQL